MAERWIADPGKGERWRDFGLRIALGFPDTYRVGMANLGYLWVFHLLNQYTEVRCDRFFVPNRQLNRGERLSTIETGRSLSEYDVVAFSIPYEGGYPEVPRMLLQGGVNPYASKRNGAPFVIAGGVAASANPEPIADFIDAVFIGEAEPSLDDLIGVLLSARDAAGSRANGLPVTESLKEALREVGGVYLPDDYRHVYNEGGELIAIEQTGGNRDVVSAVHAKTIESAAHSPVVTDESAFANRFLVEASRGCPYRCRFCLASHTSGNFREAGGITEAVARGLEVTSDVGVIGTAFTRSGLLRNLCETVSGAGGRVSFSSVRMDAAALNLLSEIGETLDLESIAVAPEVATKKLARVVAKTAIEDLDSFINAKPIPGLKKIRLYFLIGVPGEEDEDVVAIAERVKDIRIRSGLEVMCSVTPMVPKPFTPMQWAAYDDVESLKRKRKLLERDLNGQDGISLKVESLRHTREQAVLARGGRRLSRALYESAVRSVNGVEDVPWLRLMEEYGPGAEHYIGRERRELEVFPWDMLSHGVSREALFKEYIKSIEAVRSKKSE